MGGRQDVRQWGQMLTYHGNTIKKLMMHYGSCVRRGFQCWRWRPLKGLYLCTTSAFLRLVPCCWGTSVLGLRQICLHFAQHQCVSLAMESRIHSTLVLPSPSVPMRLLANGSGTGVLPLQ